MDGDFVVVEAWKDIGWLWKIVFKTIAYGKVNI
jgi:hypothetical protein